MMYAIGYVKKEGYGTVVGGLNKKEMEEEIEYAKSIGATDIKIINN